MTEPKQIKFGWPVIAGVITVASFMVGYMTQLAAAEAKGVERYGLRTEHDDLDTKIQTVGVAHERVMNRLDQLDAKWQEKFDKLLMLTLRQKKEETQ